MLKQISKQFPNLNFKAADHFVWRPASQTIYYDPSLINTPLGGLAVLHELSHALLGHQTYEYDIELLNMEVAAWSKAKQLAAVYKFKVDEDHIEDCLETYRIWLWKRSRCPQCQTTSLQESESYYRCFNCHHRWRVAQSHSLRPRRMQCL